MFETRSPRFSSSAPMDADASPLPREDTTPPVTKMNFVCLDIRFYVPNFFKDFKMFAHRTSVRKLRRTLLVGSEQVNAGEYRGGICQKAGKKRIKGRTAAPRS